MAITIEILLPMDEYESFLMPEPIEQPSYEIPAEQEVVTTLMKVEKLFNDPRPWEKWYTGAIEITDTPVAPNYDAIREAANVIGLINVPDLFHVGVDQEVGWGCSYQPVGIPAVVAVNHFISPTIASIIVWHELAHCKQHQDNGYMPLPAPSNYYNDPATYWYAPEEVEARKWEKYGLEIPLFTEAPEYVPFTIPL